MPRARGLEERLLRFAFPATFEGEGREREAHNRDLGNPPREPRDLREPSRPCRAATSRPLREPQAHRPPDGAGGPPRRVSAAVRTTDSRHALPVHPNKLDRAFTLAEIDTAWASDITYVETGEGWLYLAVVMDLASRRVIGWSMGDHMRAELVVDALTMACGHRHPAPGALHHSDRGSQYASEAFQRVLRQRGLACSMSRRGNCYDNAVVESFFGTLKTELVHRQRWPTRRSARSAIHDYIEIFYNRRRRHSHLGYLSPAEFEARLIAAPAA
ncbi:MAG: IS3 family transposase [Planctomycetota bacterium]|nr:IS3 family transposase [Planctomycetota bacterium]